MNKKALTSIIIISLLLTLSILSFIYLEKWAGKYENDLKIKTNDKDLKTNFDILKIKGPYIYLNNNFENNLSITSLKIANNECLLSNKNINIGTLKINIINCTNGLEEITPYDVTIVTVQGIISKSKLIQNPINGTLIIYFSDPGVSCNFIDGFKRLYGINNLENAHVDIDETGPTNICIKHALHTLTITQTGDFDVLHLYTENNSAVWTSTIGAYSQSPYWFNVSISGGNSYDFQINSTQPGQNYACMGSIDEDNYLGAHISDCDSINPAMTKMWLKID